MEGTMNDSLIRRLNTPQAARYLGLAPSTLEKDRVTGLLGIPHFKLGWRVVYDIEDLDAWLARRRRLHTSDDQGSADHGSGQPRPVRIGR